jgi:predicted helicase
MNFHKLLQLKYSEWVDLEKEIEKIPSDKVKGDIFEEFVFSYFTLHHDLYQISEIYRMDDIPLKYRQKYQIEKKDSGVDGLIILRDGRAAAYQVKFRTDRAKPSYAELTKFWAEARHTDIHYTVANCFSLTHLCSKNKKHLAILGAEFSNLDLIFFNEFYELVHQKKVRKPIYSPFKFQRKMIYNTLKGFKENDRGKLIAACGTGKTLTSLWIMEAMRANTILFMAPSLALIKQTLEAWSEQSKEPFVYLCVCSDKTVSDEIDDGDIHAQDMGVPVTTSIQDITDFLKRPAEVKKIVFSTYQSLDVLAKVMKSTKEFNFDLSIFDEAHRTAGAKNSALFSLALYDEHIPSKKRLFMTATERLVKPWIIKKAEEYDRTVFSMNDEKIYGPVFDRFNFGEAINAGVISDYKIIVAGIKEKEIYDLIKKNKLLVGLKEGSDEYYTYAQNIFRQVLLIKSMDQFPIKKTITFHNTVKNAKQFIDGMGGQDLNLHKVANRILTCVSEEDMFIDHVNGEMSAGDRKEILDAFKSSKYGIISNARCLIEGVDVPVIDSVYFVNSKSSLIDIIQACGRALRKTISQKNKTAYFLVPIIIPEGNSTGEIINEVDFEMLHNIIQSLRDQDLRLAEWIDNINIGAAKGKTSKFTKEFESPIVFDLPTEFDIDTFKEKLYLRIAEVNSEPTSFDAKTIKYGKKERKSDYKRIFKTLGDMSVENYKEHLVGPTIAKFTKSAMNMDEIKLNHNNVSHTERLGLIRKEGDNYVLTPLGTQYRTGKLSFDDLFRRQMLKYFSTIEDKDGKRILFPYRASLKILLSVKKINYIEFVFALYSLIDSSDKSLQEAIDGINIIRKQYPNLEITNTKNQPKVLLELNEIFGTNYSLTDVWAKKTTINNQFIYFRNHLASYSDVIDVDAKSISLKNGKEAKLIGLILKDKQYEATGDINKLTQDYISSVILFILFKI